MPDMPHRQTVSEREHRSRGFGKREMRTKETRAYELVLDLGWKLIGDIACLICEIIDLLENIRRKCNIGAWIRLQQLAQVRVAARHGPTGEIA